MSSILSNTTTKIVKTISKDTTSITPLISHVGDGIFLQTKTAQGIAGAFVWMALFITCQQVFK